MKRGDGWYKRGDDRWRKRQTDEFGARGEFIGYSDKSLSKKAYDREKDRIRQAATDRARGIKPIDTNPILEVFRAWVKEGRREGGHNGQGWSEGYAENILKFAPRILEKMKVKRLDTFRRPDFEAALGDLYPEPGTRRTMGGYVKSFLGWCVRKELMPYSPLAGWPGKKLKGTRKRRPLDIEAGELEALCRAAPLKYALAYEFAVMSGARDNEFNFIRVDWVDWKKNSVFVPGWLGTLLSVGRHSDIKTNMIYQDSTEALNREAVEGIYALTRGSSRPKKINEK